ncbi:radical SAM family heme chaperone HemW [Nitrosophilus alvini]|uniref:radical SAM family heme chaperone HemW n=1 Tax=Nitrosophilus alvini TaxID=2714855 RepID=UPI001F30B182|nr:radical SAM family heme chaperone HemW [Nitrosophilus alvini]
MLLYLHIPFCDSKCHYCSFNSYVEKTYLKKEYFEAVKKQLIYEIERFNVKKNSIETVFIGGGTPSTVEVSFYEKFFETLLPYLKKDIEITIEANPNSAKQEWLKGIRSLGVNRISFGVQSFNDKKLKFLGRTHSSKQAVNAIYNAKEAGFYNISLDLIYATAMDSKELLQKDIEIAFSLPINHLSAYSLTIEEGTPFSKTPQVQKDEENIAFWFADEIKKRGFEQYEISNFGKYRSKHNLGYWRYKDYIGIGSGAVGFLKNRRFYPSKSPEEYIKNPLKTDTEILTEQDIITEKIFLGLRSIVGVNRKVLKKEQIEKFEILVKNGKIFEKNGIYYNNNYFLADEISLFVLN